VNSSHSELITKVKKHDSTRQLLRVHPIPFVRPADSSKRDSMCGPLKSPETLEYFKFALYGWEYLLLQTAVLTDECC